MRRTLVILCLVLLACLGCDDDDDDRDDCDGSAVEWTNGHCYEAVLVPGLTWLESEAACEARGGYLATLTSADENAFAYGLVSDRDEFWFLDAFGNGLGPWIGGFQAPGSTEPDGGWEWVTGEPWDYTNWEEDQPDNGGGFVDQNRLRLFKKGALVGSSWDDCEADNPIEHRLGFLCEYGD